jgi:hypothetical protein
MFLMDVSIKKEQIIIMIQVRDQLFCKGRAGRPEESGGGAPFLLMCS